VTSPELEVLLVGLGAVAETHLTVLEQFADVNIVAGVDIRPRQITFRQREVPVYESVQQAAERHQPGLVVVATPTPAHASLCDEVARSLPASSILVEKPAAASLADAKHVLLEVGEKQPVDVAYHMAFSPEVTWARQVVQSKAASLGEPAGIRVFFSDPYQDEFEKAQKTLCSSWIDSGINALSILAHFVDVAERRSLCQIGDETESTFEAHLTCRVGNREIDAVLLTSWHVFDAAKTTRITYASGAELVMDHTAVAGYLTEDGQISAVFGSDRSVPRRDRHYQALYQQLLVEGKPIASTAASMHLHSLLLGTGSAKQLC
jgi:predicted dehydrogenase